MATTPPTQKLPLYHSLYTGPGKMVDTADLIMNVIQTAFFDAFAKGETEHMSVSG